MTIAPPPHLNPTISDLVDRIMRHREGRRTPTSMAMSPETWERLKAEPHGDRICSEFGEDRRFDEIPVRLFEGCLGVGIAYDQR